MDMNRLLLFRGPDQPQQPVSVVPCPPWRTLAFTPFLSPPTMHYYLVFGVYSTPYANDVAITMGVAQMHVIHLDNAMLSAWLEPRVRGEAPDYVTWGVAAIAEVSERAYYDRCVDMCVTQKRRRMC
jgi:hypothetical protein